MTLKRKFCLFCLIVLFLCHLNKVLSDEIKTIDGTVFLGEIVEADEEFLTLRQRENSIVSLQWRIIELIKKEKEFVIVSHHENKKLFSVLNVPRHLMSVKDIHITSPDEIASIFPGKMAARSEPDILQPAHKITETMSVSAIQPAQTSTAPQKVWKGNVDAGITVKTGNNNTFTTNGKIGIVREGLKHSFSFNGLILYETEDSETSADEQRGSFKYEMRFWKKPYYFLQESLEHDGIELLNLRSITSSGLGYYIIEKEKIKYKSEIGPSMTYEKFREEKPETTLGLRLGNYLDWQIFPSTFFYFKVDYLPELEDSESWRVESDTGVRHNINKSITWNLSWINDYDNKPGDESVSKNDATVLSTLGYNF